MSFTDTLVYRPVVAITQEEVREEKPTNQGFTLVTPAKQQPYAEVQHLPIEHDKPLLH